MLTPTEAAASGLLREAIKCHRCTIAETNWQGLKFCTKGLRVNSGKCNKAYQPKQEVILEKANKVFR